MRARIATRLFLVSVALIFVGVAVVHNLKELRK